MIDLGGRFVMPGLVDTHTHPFVDGLKELGDLSLEFGDEEATLEGCSARSPRMRPRTPTGSGSSGACGPRACSRARTLCGRIWTTSFPIVPSASWTRAATLTGVTRAPSRSLG